MEYEFTLKFVVPVDEWDPDVLIERLGKGDCDDALVGTGLPGRLGLDFTREAPTAQKAILSAIRDVKGAVPSAELVEVGPDIVGLTDVAELVGVSRQNMRKLAFKESFPRPFHAGTTVLWRLSHVCDWFAVTKGASIDRRLRDVSDVAMQLNHLKACVKVSSTIERDLAAIFEPEGGFNARRARDADVRYIREQTTAAGKRGRSAKRIGTARI